MVSGDGAAAVTLGGFKTVAVGGVEAELSARLAAASSPESLASRTCSLNLIVYCEDVDDAAAVAATVDHIARAHPIRSVTLLLDPRADAVSVRAWVKAECAESAPDQALCSEEIVLATNPDGAPRLASAVQSVLSPDLPVVLWWRGGSPFLVRLFKGLAPLVDKIVVDSILFGDGPAALDTLQRLDAAGISLADMNWERTASWRTTLAACFDDAAVLELLRDLNRCEIVFSLGEASSNVPSARSLLLAGWLVSRLPSIAGHGDVRGRSSWASPGAIVELKLTSTKNRAAVSIAWESRSSGIEAAAFDRSGARIRDWRFSPDPEDEDELLHRCVDSLARDLLLHAALQAG
jgi:glucose-6-phosphate dehydrogenase assembly protein OpcA